jgi:hypothetical protein
MITNIFKNLATQVWEVNRKYSKPRIKMTPMVKISLLSLRIYLITLIGIMLFKFVTMLRG